MKMDLQSIAPATKTVPFLGGTVEVSGLSLRAATHLIVEFPVLLALASGTADLAGLIVVGPDAGLALFAQGIKQSDNRALLEAFDRASFGEQIDILASIIDLTFRGQRARPFLESMVGRQEPVLPSAPILAESSPNSSST